MQKPSKKYWIAVVSREHAMWGVAWGYMQVCHGKRAPLSRMKSGDMMIIYSPKITMEWSEKYQKFVAIGKIQDENVYEFQMTPSFRPFRRDVWFLPCNEVDIAPILADLTFIKDLTHWWYPFRFGLFEIPEIDFLLISSKMWSYEN